VEIEVLYFDGCPNHEALLPRLRQLLEDEAIEAPIQLQLVESVEDADRQRFLGSPTLRVDGRDVDPGAADRSDYGLKCRLYRADGGIVGLPPDEWVREALRSARSGIS
jgi:hypothetical protein